MYDPHANAPGPAARSCFQRVGDPAARACILLLS